MRIGIIGSGHIGATAARLFANAGHDIAISNSRGPQSLEGLVADIGEGARAMDTTDLAKWAEVILLAAPWRVPEALPPADLVAGKIVIDAMNPYREDLTLYDLGDSTSAEETLKRLPEARLVKAFNTIYYAHLAERGRPNLPVSERHSIFVAGDDAEAKRVVMDLIEEIGFAPVDNGSLREGGKRQEPGSPIYNKVMTGAQGKQAVAQFS